MQCNARTRTAHVPLDEWKQKAATESSGWIIFPVRLGFMERVTNPYMAVLGYQLSDVPNGWDLRVITIPLPSVIHFTGSFNKKKGSSFGRKFRGRLPIFCISTPLIVILWARYCINSLIFLPFLKSHTDETYALFFLSSWNYKRVPV